MLGLENAVWEVSTNAKPTVHRATPEQIRQAWKNNYASWGAPDLLIDQYIERETLLGNTDFARDRETWVLVPPNAPSHTLSFLAACETYRRPMLIGDGKKGLREGVCVSIASVFTPKPYRGRGYAGYLLEEVMQMIKQDDIVLASTLYSEVGKTYYGKFGWDYAPSYVGTISVDHDLDLEDFPSPPLHTLTASDIPELVHHEVDHLKDDLKNTNFPTFVVLPTVESIQWMHTCADFYAQKVAKLDTPPSKLGVSLSNGDFIVWQHDWVEKKIMVLRLRASSGLEAHALLDAAIAEAQDWGMKKVVVWNPTRIVASALGEGIMKVQEREDDDSLSAVWYREEFHEGGEYPTWVINEKYAWV
ncbi:hypothetical protein HDV00_004433 [Rhizophlyctis rosea]|nr:hypothetical protein HDV00_004433 [Rhizophlyctis rosea]